MTATIIPFPAARIVRTPPLSALSDARLQALAERLAAAIDRAPPRQQGGKP